MASLRRDLINPSMMKKVLLASALALASWTSYGQITTYVLQPADLAGALDFTTPTDWGLNPDLNDPANRVQAFTVMVDDGTVGDTLGCNPLVNGTDIAGKIAILYRGTCEFGAKALTAQNAGAAAVVIINNAPGAPVGMAGGVSGAQVSIPVVMISQDAGATLHDQILAGTVEMLIGTVQNMFPNNLSLSKLDVLMPSMAGRPALVSADATEYSVALGAWVHNFGSVAQPDASLRATVTHNGSTVYDETSATSNIAIGDSAFFTFPDFTQPGYSGLYDFTYETVFGATDDFPEDNTFSMTLTVDSLLSMVPLDQITGLPVISTSIQPAAAAQVFQVCTQFIDAHASRMRAEGIYAAATINSPDNVVGQQLNASLFEWNDPVTGTSDATFTDVSEIMNGEFVFSDSLQAGKAIYIPYFEPIVLVNGQRYLFCVSTSDNRIFLGHNTSINYDENNTESDQFATILNLDGTWSVGGWVDGSIPALAVQLASATVGIKEQNIVDLTPYPNPTSNYLSIPMKGLTGAGTVTAYNVKGAIVSQQEVRVAAENTLMMDLKGLNSGTYMFHVDMKNGYRSDFRVVVTK